jgi:hypothetical protein
MTDEQTPPPPCEVCGSTHHTAEWHDRSWGAQPEDDAEPIGYATETVTVDDDDR